MSDLPSKPWTSKKLLTLSIGLLILSLLGTLGVVWFREGPVVPRKGAVLLGKDASASAAKPFIELAASLAKIEEARVQKAAELRGALAELHMLLNLLSKREETAQASPVEEMRQSATRIGT